MRLLAKLAAVAAASLCVIDAAPAGDTSKTIADQNDVLQKATREYDAATIRNLISKDFTLITNSGRLMTAEDLLNDVGDKSVTWYNNDSEDVNVRTYNDDCAVVTAVLHQRYSYHRKINDYRVRFTDTWVKLDGTWRYVAGHASMLKRLQ